MKNILRKLPVAVIILIAIISFNSCTYDEEQPTVNVTIRLSDPLEGVTVEMSNTLGHTYASMSDRQGVAHFSLPPGIYTATVSSTIDTERERTVYNGSMSDIVVTGSSIDVVISMTVSHLKIGESILIKEIYVGGCRKDDGSGKFAIDKCLILYNNSTEEISLDNLSIGIVEPYNAEASLHTFLSDGMLDYADEDWIPAINGIWYFQNGHKLAPFTELVVNICGCIDNTQTYTNSINYANPDYFTMYDVEATSSDGGKYNNTVYYPSPSEMIPTSHYLKAVKYGQANAWPISNSSPAIILFRTQDITPFVYGNNPANIIYPSDREGNLVYACLKVPREWILDAVEVFNMEKIPASKKRLTPDLDNGYVSTTNGYGHSLVRKVESMIDGHPVYKDTNNSSEDFYETDSFSLR